MMTDAQQQAALFNAERAAELATVAYRTGMEYVEFRHRSIMRGIARAYEAALADPNARIPQALQTMLWAVQQDVKNYKEPEAVSDAAVTARHAGL